jgi:ArsR family transcriptional regulator
MIQAHEDGEACVCDLTGPVGLTQPTVSHHLKVLLDVGLVEREKRGVWAYYSPVSGALDELAGLLVGRRSAGTIGAAAAPA